MVDVPHLAVPLRLTPAGRAAVVEQDGLDDVTQCVHTLITTVAGSRLEALEYGVPDLTWSTSARADGLDVAGIEAALAVWEPRAEVDLDTTLAAGAGDDVDTTAAILAGVRLT